MSAWERAAREGPGFFLEGDQEGSRRCDFEGGGGGGWSRMGGRGESNTAGITDRSRVTNVTLGTEPNDPLAYDPGLEIHHLIMSNLGGGGGQLERERDIS